MFDINTILSKLKAGIKITPEFEFLRKYDNVVKNSIFEQAEIDNLKSDLIKFAKEDGYEEGFSSDEMALFYDNAMDTAEKDRHYSLGGRTVKGWLNLISGESEKIREEVKNNPEFQKFSPAKQQFVMLIVENRLRFGNLYLDDVDNYLKEHFVEISYTDEEIEQIMPKLAEFNKIPTFSFDFMKKEDFMKFKDIDTDRVKYIIENKLYDYEQSHTFQSIALLDNETFEKAKPFLKLPMGTDFDGSDIEQLLKIPDGYERMVELAAHYKNENVNNLLSLAALPKEQYENIKDLLDKEIVLQDGKQRKLTTFELNDLSNLTKEQRDFAIKLMHIEGRSENNQLSLSYAKDIAKNMSEDVLNFIKENPNFTISLGKLSTDRLLHLKKDENSKELYKFDSKGLLETYRESFDKEKEELKVEIYNHRNNIKQESVFGKEAKTKHGEARAYHMKSEKLTYYDDNGKEIKTINTVKSALNGLPNQSVTYPDGKTVPAQYATYDSNSGARSTEKHFVSPDGTKTDYYYEETPDNTRIINYKVTDKDGKVLLDRTNTFQQVGDNKFVTSVNGRCFEIEFLENSIKITDSKTKKEHLIDIGSKFQTEKDKEVMINILKVVPGNQLIMMNHIPIKKLFYADGNENGGSWYPDTRTIGIGYRTEYSTTELEMMQSVFMHEFGHYLDSDIATGNTHIISDDPLLNELYKEEYESMIKNTTTEQSKYMSHLLEDGRTEATAESNMLLYAQEPAHNLRAMYYQMFFPKTIARMAELITERENSYLNS